MCGIAIYIGEINTEIENKFISFQNEISHRGPDAQNKFNDEKIILACNRLSIIDTAPRSNQPFHYKNFSISFNGGIFNFKELKLELEKLGHKFETESDTELILHSYEEYGEDCVNSFIGMWSFCIFDKNKNKAFFSRDRFGIKPLYYYKSTKGFWFGSEIKQFIKIGIKNLNEASILRFLEYSIVNYSNESFIKEVFQLRPGYNLIVNTEDCSFKKYEYYNIKNSSISSTETIKPIIEKS